jgi:hypothetical protein
MKTLAFAVLLFAAVSAHAGPPEGSTRLVCFPSRESGIIGKLNRIVIPKVDLRNITVSEAIEFLRQKAKQLDPEGVGVNIVLKLPAEGTPLR